MVRGVYRQPEQPARPRIRAGHAGAPRRDLRPHRNGAPRGRGVRRLPRRLRRRRFISCRVTGTSSSCAPSPRRSASPGNASATCSSRRSSRGSTGKSTCPTSRASWRRRSRIETLADPAWMDRVRARGEAGEEPDRRGAVRTPTCACCRRTRTWRSWRCIGPAPISRATFAGGASSRCRGRTSRIRIRPGTTASAAFASCTGISLTSSAPGSRPSDPAAPPVALISTELELPVVTVADGTPPLPQVFLELWADLAERGWTAGDFSVTRDHPSEGPLHLVQPGDVDRHRTGDRARRVPLDERSPASRRRSRRCRRKPGRRSIAPAA